MEIDKQKMPQHVAIIMDGNRRWAKKQGLGVVAGHAFATESVVERLIEKSGELGIKYLTLWAFSTENWNREAEEVTGVMQIFRKALQTKVQKFIERGAQLKLIGDIERFAPDIQDGMKKAIEASKNNTKIIVTFALNYGGRDEIKRASEKSQKNGKPLEENLDTAGMPDPDLIIRTGGDKRLSGFLMWQSAYSELYFTETLFPDFAPDKLEEAIEEYQNRQRRFGK